MASCCWIDKINEPVLEMFGNYDKCSQILKVSKGARSGMDTIKNHT